ncbi:dynein axonemal assembly factor 4-like isoform X2 [Rhodnius prolixus]
MLVNGEAVFELSKLEKKEWPVLHKDLSKKEMIKIKEEAIQCAHQKAELEIKEKKETKHKRHQDGVKLQIEQETILRERIDGLKNEEHSNALEEVMEWKETETSDDKVLLSTLGKALLEHNKKASSLKCVTENENSNQKKEKKKVPSWLAAAAKPVKRPPPRKGGTIKTEFTYRAFPTPTRESQLSAEEEWLKKQAEARKLTGFVAEDLRPEEKDPEWLLNRGKSFHDVGNYLGAISAFSYGIKNWDKIPELHVARAESNAAVGNWRNVLRDTSNGLDLCRPHVAANADMRFKCHYYRGLALIELGRSQSAVADLEEALELRPYDEKLHHLLERAENETPQDPQQDKIDEKNVF